ALPISLIRAITLRVSLSTSDITAANGVAVFSSMTLPFSTVTTRFAFFAWMKASTNSSALGISVLGISFATSFLGASTVFVLTSAGLAAAAEATGALVDGLF